MGRGTIGAEVEAGGGRDSCLTGSVGRGGTGSSSAKHCLFSYANLCDMPSALCLLAKLR